LPNSPGEVRIHPRAPYGIPTLEYVPRLEGSPQRLLRLAARAAVAKGNEALTAKIKDYYDQSMGIYGSPRIFCDWGNFSFVSDTQIDNRNIEAKQ